MIVFMSVVITFIDVFFYSNSVKLMWAVSTDQIHRNTPLCPVVLYHHIIQFVFLPFAVSPCDIFDQNSPNRALFWTKYPTDNTFPETVLRILETIPDNQTSKPIRSQGLTKQQRELKGTWLSILCQAFKFNWLWGYQRGWMFAWMCMRLGYKCIWLGRDNGITIKGF